MSERDGFTLVELVCVCAVLTVLMALTLPAAGWIRHAANQTRTQVQFYRWEAAMEAFRQEYGYYPALGPEAHVLRVPADTVWFRETLSGRSVSTGAPVVSGGNSRRIPFHRFSDREFGPDGRLADAFGNAEIVFLVDRNLDGRITIGPAGDYAALPAIVLPGGRSVRPLWPESGIGRGVVFYSAGRGRSEEDLVASWR